MYILILEDTFLSPLRKKTHKSSHFKMHRVVTSVNSFLFLQLKITTVYLIYKILPTVFEVGLLESKYCVLFFNISLKSRKDT